MATLSKDKRNAWRILFNAPDESRRTVYLGRVPKKYAIEVHLRIEQLAERLWSKQGRTPDLCDWVNGLDTKLRDKLVKTGLVERSPEQQAVLLGEYLDQLLASREADYKPASLISWGQVVRYLTEFFGRSADMRLIDRAAAERFRQWLIQAGLRSTTIQKRLQHARMFFTEAKKAELIEVNPFLDVRHRGGDVSERRAYVDAETIHRVIDATSDPDWKLLIALCRFGGLRCPSETLSLRWDDIDWLQNRMVVRSPKTEHLVGKGSRVVPLFPVLKDMLEESRRLATADRIFVIDPKYRQRAMGPGSWANANLRTKFEKIIRKSGQQPWSRLWHTLRASCETDLAQNFPLPVVAKWLGNTCAVAMRHYISVTDKDFSLAVSSDLFIAPKNGAQKRAQNTAANQVRPLQAGPHKVELNAKNAAFSVPCSSSHTPLVEDRGLEPLPNSPQKLDSVDSERTKSRTLEAIAQKWDTIPDEVKKHLANLLESIDAAERHEQAEATA